MVTNRPSKPNLIPSNVAFLRRHCQSPPLSSTSIFASVVSNNYGAVSRPPPATSLIHYHGGAMALTARQARSSQTSQLSIQSPRHLLMDAALGRLVG